MQPAVIIALLLSLFILILLITLFFLLQDRRKNLSLIQQKEKELSHLEQQFSILCKRHQQLKEFRNSMGEAEITTRLQAGRPSPSSSPTDHHHSEKYRFILALAEKGVDHTEIASALSLSCQEVEQVITLSSLTRS